MLINDGRWWLLIANDDDKDKNNLWKDDFYHYDDDSKDDDEDKGFTSDIDSDRIFKSTRLTHKHTSISSGQVLPNKIC